jgi:hypothetical protein
MIVTKLHIFWGAFQTCDKMEVEFFQKAGQGCEALG